MKICYKGKRWEMKRTERLCWSEKIPEGSVVRWLLLSECERGEGRGDNNRMEREWREKREKRPVKMEVEREERLFN